MKKTCAFTLAELLVTTAVGVLLIGGVLFSMIRSMVLNEYNQNFSIAQNIAREKMEQVFSMRNDFTNICSDKGQLNTETDGLNGFFQVVVRNALETGKPIIPQDCGSNNNTSLKDIEVDVCWVNRFGDPVGDCTCEKNQCTDIEQDGTFPVSFKSAVARR